MKFLQRLHILKAYIRYCLKAGNAHGLHSPFAFNFFNEVLQDIRTFYAFEQVDQYRDKLFRSSQQLTVEDFGAGSSMHASRQRKVADIAKYAGKNKKWGELLFKICNYFDAQTTLELGTSLGIGTLYLALQNSHAQVHTIEGSSAIVDFTKQQFHAMRIDNVCFYAGNFDELLEPLLQKNKFDLVYIDGNHKMEPTLRYFRQCKKNLSNNYVLVFDDIHWSKEMDSAWSSIVADPEVLMSIDVFQFGIVVFNSNFKQKQHFILRTA